MAAEKKTVAEIIRSRTAFKFTVKTFLMLQENVGAVRSGCLLAQIKLTDIICSSARSKLGVNTVEFACSTP